jgi:hypothetical protein
LINADTVLEDTLMKTSVVSMLILLTAFFSLIPVFAQPPEQKEAADANSIADANVAIDPNTGETEIEEFEGLDEALEEINRESRDEIREWTRKTEIKLNLALAVQKQITAELNFLRELAIEEGAVKTTAAIDKILLARQERFKSVIEKLEREKERLRRTREREEREEKRGRDRDRSRERSRD